MRMRFAIVWYSSVGRSLEVKSYHNTLYKLGMRINMLILLFCKMALSSL